MQCSSWKGSSDIWLYRKCWKIRVIRVNLCNNKYIQENASRSLNIRLNSSSESKSQKFSKSRWLYVFNRPTWKNDRPTHTVRQNTGQMSRPFVGNDSLTGFSEWAAARPSVWSPDDHQTVAYSGTADIKGSTPAAAAAAERVMRRSRMPFTFYSEATATTNDVERQTIPDVTS